LPYRSKRNYDSIYYCANKQKKPLKKVNLFDDNLPEGKNHMHKFYHQDHSKKLDAQIDKIMETAKEL
jgi:hypothetical protein